MRRFYPILMRVRDPQLAVQSAQIALSPEIPPQADSLRLGLVLTLAGEHPQLAWTTFTNGFDALTAANPGNRPNVLAKTAPEVFWNSIPLATLQSWATAHGDAGMADTLNDSLETARFRLDEKAPAGSRRMPANGTRSDRCTSPRSRSRRRWRGCWGTNRLAC